MPTLRAVIAGYQEHLFDLQCLAVHQGYWAGYYSNSKKPKSLNSILKKLFTEHRKSKIKVATKALPKPEVDLDTFMQRERKLNAFLERSGTNG